MKRSESLALLHAWAEGKMGSRDWQVDDISAAASAVIHGTLARKYLAEHRRRVAAVRAQLMRDWWPEPIAEFACRESRLAVRAALNAVGLKGDL